VRSARQHLKALLQKNERRGGGSRPFLASREILNTAGASQGHLPYPVLVFD
jgi:hypothetical protein